MPGLNFASDNTPYNAYGVNPGSKTYAGDTFAALTRDQWENYVGTFVPIENKLIDYATNPNAAADAMASASQNVGEAYDNQAGAIGRRLRGLGVTLSPEEQEAQTRATSISRSLADVQSQNTARDLTVQRQQSILGSPVPQGTS